MKVSGCLVAFCLLFQSVAYAQQVGPSDADRAKASAHFRRGVELFQEDAFRAALVEFQRAYDIAPDYRLLYNIGQAKLEIQDYLGAARSYEGYLSSGYLDISIERRDEVESALAALRERVASISISVNRKDAEVLIDDVKVGVSPIASPTLVNVGRHRVSARTAYGATDTKVIDVAGGDTATVALELAPPTPQQVVVMSGDKPWNPSERTAVSLWAAGGAIGVGALVTGLMTNGAQKDFDKLLERPDVSRRSIADKRSDAKTLAVTTDVLIVTSAATLVAGTVIWILGHEREQAPEAKKSAAANLHLDVGLASLGLSGQF